MRLHRSVVLARIAWHSFRLYRFGVLVALALLFPAACVTAQGQKLESCKPVGERTGPEGCWILTSAHVGKLPATPIFWTLDRYSTPESAKEASLEGGTVVEALGQVWLFTVGDKPKMPAHGTRVTVIGPIPVQPGEDYIAQYRETILPPGAVSRTHLHSGPEVFYTEAGESCLETPKGKQIGRKGVDIMAPAGEPMELVATGAETRRGIVLVLHPSSMPHTTVVTEWKSKGLCRAGD